MNETTIKIKEKWVDLYRTIDKYGDNMEFLLSGHRDEAAPTMPRLGEY